jgi:hypothetical protein
MLEILVALLTEVGLAEKGDYGLMDGYLLLDLFFSGG